jgi:hypothetical protein
MNNQIRAGFVNPEWDRVHRIYFLSSRRFPLRR